MKVARAAWWLAMVGSFVAAALCMRAHPTTAGVFFASGTVLVATKFALARRVDELAAAIARRDVDALERIADKTLAYRYQALLFVGLLGSAARARALGRVTPCVCGECETEKLDRELARALDAFELLERNDTRAAVRLVAAHRPSHPIAKSFHGTIALYVALHSKHVPASAIAAVEKLSPKAGLMRWPLVAAAASSLATLGDHAGSRRLLAGVPTAWRS